MEMRKKRIAITLGPDTLAWLETVQASIETITGHQAPGQATLLAELIEAIRADDEAAHSVGLTVESCH